MNKTEILNKCEDKEEKMLFSHLWDILETSRQRNYPVFSDFLNEAQQVKLFSLFPFYKDEIMLASKIKNSKKSLVSLKFDRFSVPTDIYKIENTGTESFSHKDVLGAVMNLGIKSEKIGDITEKDGFFFIEVKNEISSFLKENLTKIRYSPVKLTVFTEDVAVENKFEELFFTVSSLRCDCVISAVCGFSREKAKQYIALGNVRVNHSPLTDNKKILSIGDVISLRKYGRFIFEEETGLSKKDKHKIIIKKYI